MYIQPGSYFIQNLYLITIKFMYMKLYTCTSLYQWFAASRLTLHCDYSFDLLCPSDSYLPKLNEGRTGLVS